MLAMQARRAPAAQPVSRFSAEIGDSPLYGSMSAIDFTRDGGRVVLVQTAATGRRLTVRAMEQLTGTTVMEAGNPYNPFFSPDGQWVGVVTPRRS